MARMPGALWRPIPASTTRITQYDILCFHTMVGSLWGTDAYFRQGSGVNSHFGVGGDGTIVQWVDTAFRSGANLNGNWHIISVETADIGPEFPAWDTGDASQVPAWTNGQVEACAEIARWAHDTHGIPLALIPDSKVGRRGVGYHRQGVPGYMVAGGEQWSTAYGKGCPSPRRIAQIPSVITRALGAEEDFMATMSDSEKAALMEVVKAFLPGKTGRPPGGGWSRVFDTDLNVKALLARDGVDTAEFIAAVRPLMIEAVQAGMAADNAEQADEIVDRLAARLGNA